MKGPNDSGTHAHEVGQQRPRNTQLWKGGSASGGRIAPHPAAFLMTFIVCACVTGCSFLKPAPDISRHFVLTPLPATEMANASPGASGVGVIHVKIPAYLFNSSLAIRKGGNEIVYPPGTLWAERLNTGIPRVLAADLSSLLPSEQIRLLSVGPGDDAAKEIGVTIDQFDVSSTGQAVLVAKWRILSPGGEQMLRSGESRFSRSGPAPDTDPSGAIGTLSDLIADLSRQLAQALNDT
ncbi:MAG: membrane integrity-associated transporter subunit PqiC [Steroidobacteraceae bacterium]